MTRRSVRWPTDSIVIGDIPDVGEAHHPYSDPGCLLQVAAADSAAYETLYTSKLCALPGVPSVRSQMIVRTVGDGSALPIASK